MLFMAKICAHGQENTGLSYTTKALSQLVMAMQAMQEACYQ